MNAIACSLVVVVVACSQPTAPPQAPAANAGKARRFQIDSFDAIALADGHLAVPNDGKLVGIGVPPAEIAEVLGDAGLPRDTIHLDIQVLLVAIGDRVILFDAGAGAQIPTAGQLLSSLAQAGVAPVAVTDVLISHAHGDHVGGLVTRSDALAFPAATIRMSAPEWASLRADADPVARRLVAAIGAKVVAFEPGAQVLPQITAIATPGHTAGHSSYEVAGSLIYLGDVAHHAVLSVQRPGWPIAVDEEGGPAMRQQMLAKLAAERTRVFAGHFPYPGIGHIEAGAPLTWRPD